MEHSAERDAGAMRAPGLGGRPIVVVVGMHRSGTSLCSNVLSLLGVDMADEANANPANPRGHFERLPLVAIQDEILALFDRGYYSASHDLPFPPGWWADLRLPDVKERIKALLRPVVERNGLFGFKDPRTARLLPLWKQIFAELDLQPRYVVCLRDPAHVAASLHTRDGLDPQTGALRTLDYLVDAFRYTRGGDRCFVRYDDWMPDPVPNATKLLRFLGLDDRIDAADLDLALHDTVRPELNRSGRGGDTACDPLVRGFFALAARYADSGGTDEALGEEIHRFTQTYVACRRWLIPFEARLRETAEVTAGLVDSLAAAERRGEASRDRAEQAEERLAEALARVDDLTAALSAAHARSTGDGADLGRTPVEATDGPRAE